ncbi:MAG: NAD(P)H-binding protein [Rubrivivax sp.]
MTVALFGASGAPAGCCWPKRRAAAGLRALARDASKLPRQAGLDVIVGDARDSGAIDETLRRRGRPAALVRAVFCTLGMADIAKPATDFSDSVRAIVAGMRRAGIRRIVAVASGVALPDAQRGGYRGEHGVPEVLRNVAAEHMRNHHVAPGGRRVGLAVDADVPAEPRRRHPRRPCPPRLRGAA